MELSGKVISLLPLQKGQGKSGEWKKQEFIVETTDQYPKKVCISAWGDKIDQFGLAEGENVTVSVNLESREYNGRWYTDVRAWKVVKEGSGGSATPPPPGDFLEPDNTFTSGEPDDLPF